MTVTITRRGLDADGARREVGRCRDAKAGRRMLALALVPEGYGRAEAARHAGTDRQPSRDRVHRYDAEGLAGLRDRPIRDPGRGSRPGRKPGWKRRWSGGRTRHGTPGSAFGRLPADFPASVAAALPEHARGKPVESLPRT